MADSTSSGKNAEKANENNALRKSVAGAATLISANAFARTLTFALNQILVMYFTTPAVLGVVHVQLELLLSTILFLGREPARMTILRGMRGTEGANDRNGTPSSARTLLRDTVALAYVSVLLGICLTVGATLWLGGGSSDHREANTGSAYTLYAAASLLELLAEPMYLVGQHRLMLSQRAQVEAAAAASKTGAIVAAMAYFFAMARKTGSTGSEFVPEKDAVIAFAIGQVAYGLAILLGWVWQWSKEFTRISAAIGSEKKRDGLRSAKNNQTTDDEDSVLISQRFSIFGLSWATQRASGSGAGAPFKLDPFYFTYCWQSVLKFLLNEGDRILLNWLATPEQQGVWAFVFNYGSLLVRIVFLPIEDSLRAYMSKSMADGAKGLAALASVLSTVFHLYLTYLALPMWFIAPNYAQSLVTLVGGSKWLHGGAPIALAFYCRFLPVLASNGAMEAFVQTVADPDSMSAYSWSLVLFWIVFASSAWALMIGFLHLGAAGMIAAAMFNAALRLQWGARFAHRLFNKSQQQTLFSFISAFPSDPVILLTWLAAWAGTWQTTTYISALSMAPKKRDLANLVVAAMVAAVCMAITVYRDRPFWRRLSELRKQM